MTDTVIMTKGETVDLKKQVPSLSKVRVAAGWDEKQGGPSMDLDLAAFILDTSGNVRGKDDFIFFNNLKNNNGSVTHLGDNLTGAGEGDDEIITIDLDALDPGVASVDVYVNIYNATGKGQSLADIDNCFVRIVNDEDQHEIAKFEITEAMTGDTMLFGQLVRNGETWEFVAKGDTRVSDLGAIATEYGLRAAA